MGGAIIVYFVLILIEGYDFSIIVELLFGSPLDDYVNLHSLVLIISMMIIVEISNEAGVFQFIAYKLIKISGGRPMVLMTIFCLITVLISSILNNILTVIIIIPLTITVSRILNINPTPYILTQAILVNIGGTVFLISSIPNILITSYAHIEFLEFFMNVGLVSLVVFGFTLLLFILLYRKKLTVVEADIKVLKEFNAWNVVQNKFLFYQSAIALIVLLVLFIFIPSSLISSDIIALSIAVILIISSKLNPKEIISRIDFELILYLMGIFIIAGGLEVIGFTDLIGNAILVLAGIDPFLNVILILWFSAYLSSTIDNIPITKVLIPVAGVMAENVAPIYRNQVFYSLAFGANWGDNLTPLGDNILVMNLAEQNKRPIKFKQFFKLGFVVTNYQLLLLTVYYSIIYHFFFGLMIGLIFIFIIFLIVIFIKIGPNVISRPLINFFASINNYITGD